MRNKLVHFCFGMDLDGADGVLIGFALQTLSKQTTGNGAIKNGYAQSARPVN
jgi:hypothetical protein